jgi:hypothetical protein
MKLLMSTLHSVEWMADDSFRNGVVGSSCDLIKVLSQYFPGGTEENLSQDS